MVPCLIHTNFVEIHLVNQKIRCTQHVWALIGKFMSNSDLENWVKVTKSLSIFFLLCPYVISRHICFEIFCLVLEIWYRSLMPRQKPAGTAPKTVCFPSPWTTAPEIIKLFPCSIQLSMEFQLLIKTKMLKNIGISCFYALRWCIFILLINVKMPTNVGILTFISRINFMLSWVEHNKVL